jgi:hypothetical protein
MYVPAGSLQQMIQFGHSLAAGGRDLGACQFHMRTQDVKTWIVNPTLTTNSPGFFSTRLKVCRGRICMLRACRLLCRHVLSSLPPTGLRLMDLVNT